MFIDNVKLTLSSGKGGAGAVSFRTEKFVIKGGPDGGDGGRGGDVFFKVDKNSHTLSNYRGRNHMKAKNGRPGEGRKKYGKKGESLTLIVPPGTQVIDEESGEVLLDLVEDGEVIKFLEGGKGGLGNWHFRSSTNQRPTYAQPGLPGVTKEVRLELKLIADVGLVGFPNVGKSTLISVVSNATPEIANYEFTTLTPKLGVVKVDDFNSFVMADIPGIIGGASEGKGLGLDFLKHIERTGFLLFMLDIANYRTLSEQYQILKKEVESFSKKLSQRGYAVAITRVDAIDKDEANIKIDEFLKEQGFEKNSDKKYKFDGSFSGFYQELDERGEFDKQKPYFIAPISSISRINIEPLKYAIYESTNILKKSESDESSS